MRVGVPLSFSQFHFESLFFSRSFCFFCLGQASGTRMFLLALFRISPYFHSSWPTDIVHLWGFGFGLRSFLGVIIGAIYIK